MAIQVLERQVADGALDVVLCRMLDELVVPFEYCVAVLAFVQPMPLPFLNRMLDGHMSLQALDAPKAHVALRTRIWFVVVVLVRLQLCLRSAALVAFGTCERVILFHSNFVGR